MTCKQNRNHTNTNTNTRKISKFCPSNLGSFSAICFFFFTGRLENKGRDESECAGAVGVGLEQEREERWGCYCGFSGWSRDGEESEGEGERGSLERGAEGKGENLWWLSKEKRGVVCAGCQQRRESL